MKSAILDAIAAQVVVADGAVGTELQRAGLGPGACCEAWNVEQPEKVSAIHSAYVDAGAQLITTNSFRGNRVALSDYGLQSRVEELNRAAAQLARKAAAGSAFVMGSVGPLGGLLEPRGEIAIKAAFDAFAEQARALVRAGVDAIIIETMTAMDELELAALAARQAGAPFVITTVAFDKVRDGYETLTGVGVGQAVEAMARAGADILGCNCGAGMSMEDYVKVIEQVRALSDKPVIARPNAGQPELVEGRIVYRRTPELMAGSLDRLIKAGAGIIGGCCGTTPEHIRSFKEAALKTTRGRGDAETW